MANTEQRNDAVREALTEAYDYIRAGSPPERWAVMVMRLSKALSPSPASSPVAREVMTLVIAARAAWEEMQDLAVSRLNLDNLDRALEAFSSRVPYENEPKGATASSPVGEGDNALLNTARRNIRTFINGASFKCSADKEAALACVDVLESNLSQPTPASARDNQAIWDALRDFTLADGRTLESFFVKGNDKINFCCLIASLSPLSGEPASVAGEAETLIAAGFDDYAAHCALKTESDGGFCHAYFYSDGQWRFQTGGHDLTIGKDTVRCVLTKRLYAHPPLSKPTPVEAGLREDNRKMRQALDLISTWSPNTGGRLFPVATAQAAIAALSENPPPPSQE